MTNHTQMSFARHIFFSMCSNTKVNGWIGENCLEARAEWNNIAIKKMVCVYIYDDIVYLYANVICV